jgi:hypothetical protein
VANPAGPLPGPRTKERAINPPSSAFAAAHLLGEVTEPILFNTWKHHAGALRQRVRAAAAEGEPGLDVLAAGLVVMGTELMDLYTGALTPAEIASRVLAHLRAEGRVGRDDYRAWLDEGGGYRVIPFTDDSSRWVLRLGDVAGRYVHVHPARRSPETRRVRANVLKTAVLVLADALAHGGDPLDVARINRVRGRHLGLSPVGRLTDDQGLQAVLSLLRTG